MSLQNSPKKPQPISPPVGSVRRPGEGVFACLLLIFSLFVVHQAYNISGFTSISSPGALPLLAAAFLLVSSIFISITAFKLAAAPSKAAAPGEEVASARGFFPEMAPPLLLVFGVVTLGYISIIDVFGFVLSSASFLFLSTLYLHRKGVIVSLLISVNTLAVIYIVFRVVFKVILPEGSLFE
ncbi:MAG: putative tricarboxylic transport membrane protein [Patiriisocius sp.]|jgi:putative tricarboxylic transport membrane protein